MAMASHFGASKVYTTAWLSWRGLSFPIRLLLLDFGGAPAVIEPGLQGPIEPQAHEPSFARSCLKPVGFLSIWSRGAEPQSD